MSCPEFQEDDQEALDSLALLLGDDEDGGPDSPAPNDSLNIFGDLSDDEEGNGWIRQSSKPAKSVPDRWKQQSDKEQLPSLFSVSQKSKLAKSLEADSSISEPNPQLSKEQLPSLFSVSQTSKLAKSLEPQTGSSHTNSPSGAKSEVKKKDFVRSALASSGRMCKVLDHLPSPSDTKVINHPRSERSANLDTVGAASYADSDSSDEEERRNPMESKYNDYGKFIKKRIAHESQQDVDRQQLEQIADKTRRSFGGCPSKPKTKTLAASSTSSSSSQENVFADFYSGIRIIFQPKNFKFCYEDTLLGFPQGKQYSIWTMNDLRDTTKNASLFLFGDANKEHWKCLIGTVVGILNPSLMESRQKDGDDTPQLSINQPDRLLMMGVSKDLGKCKARKRDGQPCAMLVNKNECEYCIFHIQKEYKKTSAKRSELQACNGTEPKKLLKKLFGNKEQYLSYNGGVYTTGGYQNQSKGTKTNTNVAKKDSLTLQSLKLQKQAETMMNNVRPSPSGPATSNVKHLSKQEAAAVVSVAEKRHELGELLLAPTPGSRNLLSHLAKEDEVKSIQEGKITPLSARDLLKMHQSQRKSIEMRAKPALPQLGKGLTPGQDIVFGDIRQQRTAAVKEHAIKTVLRKGGIKKSNPNAVRKKKEDRKLSLEIETSNEDKEDPLPSGSGKKTSSLLGDLNMSKEAFKKLLEQKSRNTNLIDMVENENQEKYFQALEKKETLEQKMLDTMEVPVTVVVCSICNYRAMQPSEMCKEQQHPLKRAKGMKRFFKCQKCSNRTVTVEKLPTLSCRNCGSDSWERVAMISERKGPKLDSEIFSVRGDERKHLTSLDTRNIYLHL